jgi:hypothetical protein
MEEFCRIIATVTPVVALIYQIIKDLRNRK